MLHDRRSGRLDPIDFQQLKSQVSVLDVLELFDWKPASQRGEELRGPCPVHGSSSTTSMTLAVSPSKNAWKCHKCGAGGNQLDLAAYYFHLPRDQVVRVAVALCRQLGREIPRTEKRS